MIYRILKFVIQAMVVAFVSLSAKGQNPIHQSFAIQPDATVTVSNLRGSIRISGWDEPRAQIDITSSDRDADANAFRIDQSGDRLFIDTSGGASGKRLSWRGQVTVELRVPRGLHLDSITTASGEIIIEDVGSRTRVRSTSGNIRVTAARGEVRAATSSGNITIDEAAGPVSLSAGSGKINLLRIKGTVTIEVRSGDVAVTEAAGDTSISSKSGSLRIAGVGGNLRATTLSGSIGARKISGEARMNTLSDTITGEDIGGRVIATAISGDVKLTDVRNGVQASTVSGSIRIQNASGPLEAQTTGGNITLGGVSSRNVKAACHSSNIAFDGEVFDDGRYSFDSFSGSVTLTIPRNSNFSFSGRTLSGQISSEFAFRETPQNNPAGSRRSVTGTYGNDTGARIAATTFSGSVRLKIR